MYPAAIEWALESSYPRVGDRMDGRYELRTLVEDHGTAVSLTALDHESGREVAITALDPGRVHANAALARCLAGVAGLRGLYVPRFMAVPAPRAPYLVGEPPAGTSLAQLLARTGPLPWERVLTIAERCLEILRRAYTATRTAHRALTPARCIVDAADSVVLTDYGWVEIGGPDEVYRAPEQVGTTGDERSDVYTLAAIAFEAIAGKRPEPRASAQLLRHVPVPFSVDALFTRALVEDPARRPGLAELRRELRELLGLPPAPVESPPLAREVNLGPSPVNLPPPSRPPAASRPPRPAEEQTLILPEEPEDPLPRTLAGTEQSPFRPPSARSPTPTSGSDEPLPRTLAGTEQSPFRPTSPRSPTPGSPASEQPLPRTLARTEQSPFRPSSARSTTSRRRVSLDEALQRQAIEDPRPKTGSRPGEPTEVPHDPEIQPRPSAAPVTQLASTSERPQRPARSPDDPVTLAFKPQPRPDTPAHPSDPPPASASGPIASASAPVQAVPVAVVASPPTPTAPLPVIRAATSPTGRTGKPPPTKSARPLDERTALRQFLASPAAHRWLLRLVVFNTVCVLLLLLLHVLG